MQETKMTASGAASQWYFTLVLRQVLHQVVDLLLIGTYFVACCCVPVFVPLIVAQRHELIPTMGKLPVWTATGISVLAPPIAVLYWVVCGPQSMKGPLNRYTKGWLYWLLQLGGLMAICCSLLLNFFFAIMLLL